MKRYLIIPITILPFLISSIIGSTIGCTAKADKQATTNDKTAQLYKTYCISCHNDKKSSFINRQWLFGNSKEEIFKSIKHGRNAFGMPPFGNGLSDEQINELSDYVIKLANQHKEEVAERSDKGEVHESEEQKFRLELVLDGLDVPWGLEFLPDGSLLISERNGQLLHYRQGHQAIIIDNTPEVIARGQGGLLDLELHPQYEDNGWIYLAYSAPDAKDKSKGNTAIMRAQLIDNQLTNKEVIFQALPLTDKRHHYGCKLEFDKEGYLYFSVGDRGERDRHPQALDNDCGKVHRIHDDGRIPSDNPFVATKDAQPSIYSYGHRNPQGLCMHPVTGRIWTDEHGPKGGDEINIIEAGKNYGWPLISFGINYNGTIFTNDTARAGMEQPLHYWVPSIAPCGMTFVKGDRYPNWKNNILTGSLRFEYLHRVVLEGDKVVHEEKLLEGIGRVRNVEMSPDGYIYIAVEKPGKIYRLIPL